ncbi:unnamed protein product [Gongylonema pulchrum]|uniref:Sulfide:quinone oxidoreductase, mitochondrial n=1 Tax=Gongylonema pulchrum TaxID=637853 RepID=A0A183DSQ6_9BILA|nr:unnamed protein product [Gongylonema pulchrum]
MGGGAGGCGLSHRLARYVKQGQMAVIEPSDLKCGDGREVTYEFLIVAAGLQLRYELIEGLPEAFKCDRVNSVYTAELTMKMNRELNSFRGGTAIYTFPNTPIKCAGAPQKICYLSDDFFRKSGVRDRTRMMYNTSLGRIFGVEKYAKGLMKVIQDRNIELNTRHNLIKVDPLTQTASFELLDDTAKPTGKTVDFHYDLIHVAPPCSPVEPLRKCKDLTDEKGWLDVDPDLLVSKRFENVFGIGDCLNTPNAKTAAAYDGYASCPLLVSMNRVILAEFNSAGPLETLPIDQGKPLYVGYLVKRYLLPWLYWGFLVKGWWLGPARIRQFFHPIDTLKSLFVVPVKKSL